MSEPFLWESPFELPSGIQMPHMTALSNGTFLAMGKISTSSGVKIGAWIYNAEGSLKAEQVLDVPDPGPRPTNDSLDLLATNPLAVELSDGRVAITWTVATPASGGKYIAPWTCIYDGDLKPVGVPKPVFETDSGDRDYAETIVALSNGSFVISDRNEQDGHAYLRVFSPDGTRSPAIDLGTAGGSGLGTIVTDVAALSDGRAVVVVRTNTSTLTGYVLTSSATGGHSLSAPFAITAGTSPTKGDVKVTALKDGRFVVTWAEFGSPEASEPSVTVRFQVYGSEGNPLPGGPKALYATVQEAASVGTPDVIALPDGGFAMAAQVVPNASPLGSEIRLVLFDANGVRISDELLVSKPASQGTASLEGLSLMADGRIVVHMSSGLQIVDPRDEAVLLKGTAGKDHYIGTAFNDTFEGSAGADILNGDDGFDYVSFAHAKAGVTASLSGGSGGDAADDTYTGIEGLIGSSFNDVFFGNGSALLKGGLGNDTYYLKAGDAFEEAVGGGRDTVIVSGSYGLSAGAQIEVLKLSGVSSKTTANLTGSDIANEIRGHAGKNTLKGQGGNDTLYGGNGNDGLYGGSGKDTFVFDTTPNKKTNVDRIYDFNPTYDSIQLENKIFTKLGKGSSKGVKFNADMFVKASRAQDREDRVIYDKKTGALYYDKDGTGSSAQVKIATLNKNLKLTYHDFYVI